MHDVNRQARQWLAEVANVRIHRETRERPDHYIECPACATVLQDAIEYVTAMRAATEVLASKTPRRAVAGGVAPGSS